MTKMKQIDLFETMHELDKSKRKPATELMKKVAEKAPQKRKILKDFSPAEAEEILGKVAEYKNKQNNLSEAEEKLQKEQRELIYRTKQIAKQMEMGNKSKIILFPSYSRKSRELNWYKLGDFSAQYFMYRMADRMGRSPKPRKDNDRFARMHVIVSISDADKFVEQAMKLNEFERHEITLDKIHILYLKKELTDDEVAILQRTEEMRKEMMHNVLRPRKAVPEIYLDVLTLGRQITKMTEGMDRICRIEIGDKVVASVMSLMETYFDFVGGLMNAEMARIAMQRQINKVRVGMAFLGDEDAVVPMKACAIGETIAKIEGRLKDIK